MRIYSEFTDWINQYWVTIVIIVASILVGVWLIALIFALSFSGVFKRRLNNGSKTLNLLLKERRATLLRYVDLAEKHGLEISKEDIKGINRLERVNDFQALSKENRDERIFAFIKASHNIVTMCRRSREFAEDEEFEILEGMYNDLEDAYRQKCAKYNSDVLGYNYWIKIPMTGLIMKMLKRKPKDQIV